MELPVSPAAKYTQNTTSTPESREKCKLLLGCHTHQGRSLTSVWKRGPVPFSSCLALILSILQELGVREWSPLTSCHCPLDISLLWDTGVENEIYQTGVYLTLHPEILYTSQLGFVGCFGQHQTFIIL